MKDEMAVELWSTLPLELVERTLSFLSVPVLCRLRTVCKKWNSLICKPEFGALCVRHAAGQDGCFVVLRETHGYSFLDISARRWYTIRQEEQRVFGGFKLGIMVAVDGGLVCRHLYAREGASVFVSNPLARTSRRLPSCPATAASVMPRLTLVVDNMAHAFKIFLMPNGEDRRGVDPLMVIYESTTNEWRHSTSAPSPPFGPHINVESCIFLDGLLYVLMAPCTTAQVEQYWLWSYDHVEDSWKDTCVDIHMYSLQCPELVVSDNRLFLASWIRKCPDDERPNVDLNCDSFSQFSWAYEIREVHLAEKTLSSVFQLTEAAMMQLGSFCLKAIGCCKAIMLMCWASGISILYDLSTSLWDSLPVNPSIHSHNFHKLFWYGSKSMNLALPEWDLQPES